MKSVLESLEFAAEGLDVARELDELGWRKVMGQLAYGVPSNESSIG